MFDAYFYSASDLVITTSVEWSLLSNNIYIKRYYIDDAELKTVKVDVPYTDGSLDLTDTIVDGKKFYKNRLIEIQCKSYDSTKYMTCCAKLHGKVKRVWIKEDSDTVVNSNRIYWTGRVSVKNFQSKDDYYEWSIIIDADPYWERYSSPVSLIPSTSKITALEISIASFPYFQHRQYDKIFFLANRSNFVGTKIGFTAGGVSPSNYLIVPAASSVHTTLSALRLTPGNHMGLWVKKTAGSGEVYYSFDGTSYYPLPTPVTSGVYVTTPITIPASAVSLYIKTTSTLSVTAYPINMSTTITASDIGSLVDLTETNDVLYKGGVSPVYIAIYPTASSTNHIFYPIGRGL